MRVRLQALALIALIVHGCSTDVHLRLLEPASGPHSDAGAKTAAAGHEPIGGGGGRGGAGGTGAIGSGGKKAPGSGGRGAPDAGKEPIGGADAARDDAGATSSGLEALILRYDFSGQGTRVADRVGTKDARLIGGAMLDGDGGVSLDGSDDYVDMPNGLVSKLDSATFVSWLEWSGGVCWQRIFDFGANSGGEGAVGSATSSLFLAASSCNANQLMALAEFSSSEYGVHANGPLPSGRLVQVALVFNTAEDTFRLYLDGEQIAKDRAGFELSDVDDVNNWLGRSQWVQDINLRGRYDEFRIYAAALSPSDIGTLFARGPDTL